MGIGRRQRTSRGDQRCECADVVSQRREGRMEPLSKANFPACWGWGLLAMAISFTCVMEVESTETYGLRSIASGNAFIAQRFLVATVLVSGFLVGLVWDTVLHRFVMTRDSRKDMVVDEGKAESACAREEDGAGAVAANVTAMIVEQINKMHASANQVSNLGVLIAKGPDLEILHMNRHLIHMINSDSVMQSAHKYSSQSEAARSNAGSDLSSDSIAGIGISRMRQDAMDRSNSVVAALLGEWKEDEKLRANELASSGADQDESESSMCSMNDNVGSGSSSTFGIVRNASDNSLGSMYGKKSSGKSSPALGLGAAATNEGSETRWMPKYVWELLEPEMRSLHEQHIQKVFEQQSLPSSLHLPIRNATFICRNQQRKKAHVSIGSIAVGATDALFYAVFSEMTDPASLSASLLHPYNEDAAPILGASQNNSFSNSVSEDGSYTLSRMFSTPTTGQGQDDCIGTEPIDSGTVKEENHEDACVLFLDILGFSTALACLHNAEAASDACTQVHTFIDAQIAEFHLRKIQSWGDCYLIVAGTSWVDNDSKDTQMCRMRDMACSTSQGLADILENMPIFNDEYDIRVRLGIDYGKINISYIYTTNKLVSTISIFGDTVNTAARMEQTCLPYMVHLTRDAAIRLAEEIDMPAEEEEEEKITQDSIPWSEMQVKSKGTFQTAWIDIFTMKFADVTETALDTAFSTLKSRSMEDIALTELMTVPDMANRSPRFPNQAKPSQMQWQASGSISSSFAGGRRALLATTFNSSSTKFSSFSVKRRSSLAVLGSISGSFLQPVYEKRRASAAGFVVLPRTPEKSPWSCRRVSSA